MSHVMSWPLYVGETILEQLINGTLPSSVSANIVMFIQRFSPVTKIKEQPSILTVRRGRTVLLVVMPGLSNEVKCTQMVLDDVRLHFRT
jgi:hypothetical protein